MRVAVLGLVAACSSSPAPSPDAAPPPISYTLNIGRSPGTRAVLPDIFVDGVQTNRIDQTYPDLASAAGFRHLVELRYAGHILASYPTAADTIDCTSHVDGDLTSVAISLDALDSGDVRFFADDIRTTNGGCLGDGFDIASCYCPGERCVPRITLADPLFTRMACAPIGAMAAGDPCTLTDDPDGVYDDCGKDLVCYQGTCHALCSTTPCATTCVQPDGYPNEGAFCM